MNLNKLGGECDRWLQGWQEGGVFEHILEAILSMVQLNELIDWSVASVNGSFFPWKRGGDGVAHRFRVRAC